MSSSLARTIVAIAVSGTIKDAIASELINKDEAPFVAATALGATLAAQYKARPKNAAEIVNAILEQANETFLKMTMEPPKAPPKYELLLATRSPNNEAEAKGMFGTIVEVESGYIYCYVADQNQADRVMKDLNTPPMDNYYTIKDGQKEVLEELKKPVCPCGCKDDNWNYNLGVYETLCKILKEEPEEIEKTLAKREGTESDESSSKSKPMTLGDVLEELFGAKPTNPTEDTGKPTDPAPAETN